MKNKIYLLALICSIIAVTEKTFSQTYLSLFGDTSTTWDIILHGYCDAVCSQTIVVNGDTTINANTYKVISGLPGFVREDNIQGKAWFYSTNNNTEYLVMDLSLKLGDTFNLYNWSNDPNPFVVDSVYYVSSKKHVRLNAWTSICSMNEKITFIEGSGTTASLFYQRDLHGNFVTSYMLCQHKNGLKVAGNILFSDSCYICSVGTQEYNSDINSVKIFPNPAIDILSIETRANSLSNFNLTIYNVFGEHVISQPIKSILTDINISNLHRGVYIVKVGDSASNKLQMLLKQ